MSTTVDSDEIARYNSLASTWWQPEGPMWPLHKLNDLRAPYVQDQICTLLAHDIGPEPSKPLTGLTVLDIGCGAGLLAEALARRGASVVGVDPAARNIAIAAHHATRHGLEIDYRIGSIDVLKPSERFDVVLNMEVIEHVERLPNFLEQCCKHVRPGGLHFIATLNRTVMSFLVAIIGAEFVLRWLPRGTHQWRKFVRPDEVQNLLAQHNQLVVAKTGVSINPLTRHYRLSQYFGVNYMLAARNDA